MFNLPAAGGNCASVHQRQTGGRHVHRQKGKMRLWTRVEMNVDRKKLETELIWWRGNSGVSLISEWWVGSSMDMLLQAADLKRRWWAGWVSRTDEGQTLVDFAKRIKIAARNTFFQRWCSLRSMRWGWRRKKTELWTGRATERDRGTSRC